MASVLDTSMDSKKEGKTGRKRGVGQSHVTAYDYLSSSLCLYTGAGSKPSACGTRCTG